MCCRANNWQKIDKNTSLSVATYGKDGICSSGTILRLASQGVGWEISRFDLIKRLQPAKKGKFRNLTHIRV